MTEVSPDVKTADGQVQKCIPDEHGNNSVFLRFPFSELKAELNLATQNLFLLTISSSSSRMLQMMTFEKRKMT